MVRRFFAYKDIGEEREGLECVRVSMCYVTVVQKLLSDVCV